MKNSHHLYYKSSEDSRNRTTSLKYFRHKENIDKNNSLEAKHVNINKKKYIDHIKELLKKPENFKKALEAALVLKKQDTSLTYELNFSINYNTFYGERLVITGEPEFIGNWDPLKGLELEWSEGNIWKSSVLVGEGDLKDFEYKYACIKGHEIVWESGDNRLFSINRGVKNKAHIVYHTEDYWQI